MKGTLALLRYSLRRMRGPMLAVWVLLFALQILMTLVAGAFEMSGRFQEMASFIPDFIRPFLDPSFLAAMSFQGMVCFGYSHLIVILLLIAQAIAAGTEPVDEIESKLVDLLMCRPIGRHVVVARSVGVIVLVTLVSVSSMLAGSCFGLAVLTPDSVEGPPARVLLSLALNLSLLVIAWGGVALGIAALSKRRMIAATATGLTAFATFILDYVGRLWDPAERLAPLSPFRYYAPFRLIAGEPFPTGDGLVLSGIFAVGCIVAFGFYSRRDL